MAYPRDALARTAEALTQRREPFVRATVVRAQRPTSAHAGDTAVVDAAGRIDGFVGGACVEASVRYYALRQLARREPVLLRVVPGEPNGTTEEGAVEVANPCLSGGAVEIFLEPWHPSPRIVVVGTTPVARALGVLAVDLGFELAVHDPAGADTADPGAGAPTTPRPDDAALIVASHGRGEEPALEAALRAGVPYVALVSSRSRGAAVLASLEVDDDQRARVFNPAGLDLGGRTPGEIALSILAQLVAERAARPGAGTDAATVTPAPESEPGAPHAVDTAEPAAAIDPVCGMTVAAVESTLNYEHDGLVRYFCSSGCRAAFVADPGRFAPAPPPAGISPGPAPVHVHAGDH